MSNTNLNPLASAEETKLAEQDPVDGADYSAPSALPIERTYTQQELNNIVAGAKKGGIEKGQREGIERGRQEGYAAYEAEIKPILDGYPNPQAAQDVSYQTQNFNAPLGASEVASIMRNEIADSQWRERVMGIDSRGMQSYSDYGTVTGILGSQIENPDVKEVIDNAMLHPNASDILYELGKNPDELARCMELKPAGLRKRFTSLAVKKQSAGETPLSPRVVYKETAAPPVSGMPSNDTGVATKIGSDDLTQRLLRGESI
ncbi:MAG: hypothetical protein JKY48_02490 [Flavobacteriales bacterium]|nr:hypothetical protein [Flavobacteriales bacterium]